MDAQLSEEGSGFGLRFQVCDQCVRAIRLFAVVVGVRRRVAVHGDVFTALPAEWLDEQIAGWESSRRADRVPKCHLARFEHGDHRNGRQLVLLAVFKKSVFIPEQIAVLRACVGNETVEEMVVLIGVNVVPGLSPAGRAVELIAIVSSGGVAVSHAEPPLMEHLEDEGCAGAISDCGAVFACRPIGAPERRRRTEHPQQRKT